MVLHGAATAEGTLCDSAACSSDCIETMTADMPSRSRAEAWKATLPGDARPLAGRVLPANASCNGKLA